MLTCAVGVALTGGVDGVLADLPSHLELAAFAAGAVPVTEQRKMADQPIGEALNPRPGATRTCTLLRSSAGTHGCSSGPS